jgi:hypothetical protein
VQHRRLAEAARVLVRARDHEIGAGGESVLGQRVAERQVRPPRLVDHERHAVGVGDPREAAHVGHRAVIGRRDDDRRGRARRRPQGGVERGRPQAVRDSELDVGLGRDERGAQPGQDEPVDRAAVNRPLDDDAVAASRDRQARRQVALRRSVGQEPRAARAPRFGGEP